MIELRISGNSTSELLREASNVLLLLAKGAAPSAQPAAPVDVTPADVTVDPVGDPFPAGDNVGAETLAEPMENPKAGGKPSTRGRKPRAQAPIIEAEAHPPAQELPAADFLDEQPADEPAEPVTIDDVKSAVQRALAAAQARLEGEYPDFSKLAGKQLEAANQEVMSKKVALVKPLLAKFKAAKVTDLKPEHYAGVVRAIDEFIAAGA